MKKKIISVVLVVILLLQLMAGCSKEANGGEQSGSESSKGDELKLGIVAAGYGDEWLRQLAKAYEKKTGVKTTIVKTSSSGSWVTPQLVSGPKYNDTDIVFDIRATAMSDLSVKNYVQGYERAYADLSSIYDSVPQGYNTDKTVEELFGEYMMKAVTWDLDNEGFGDGKQYFVAYATGLEGLVYNKGLFEKYSLEEPRTSNEFFELCDKIKTINKGGLAKNDEGRDIYPFAYSGRVDYTNFLTHVWWAQYDGLDVFYNMLEGKDATGQYTAESLRSPGKLSAYQNVAKLLDSDNKYSSPNSYSQSFTNSQVLFLDNQAFMMCTGEWVEREMAANFPSASLNMAFMRIPVNSDIIQVCDTVTTEERLSETIAYIDGDIAERPAYLSDADLAHLKEARSIYMSEGNQHIAFVPAYSNMLEEAKDFLLFMLSKEGQEIVLEYSHGNMAPLGVDMTQFDAYSSLSLLQRSKYDVVYSSSGLNLVGKLYTHPMNYVGGLSTVYGVLEQSMAVVKTSSSYKTPYEIWNNEYKKMAEKWDEVMKKAGLSK